MILDEVLDQTAGGPRILGEQNDSGQINWAAGLSDPGEMIACGYLPEARRQFGETDAAYQARLISMDMPAILGPERFATLLQAAINRAKLGTTRDGKVAMFSALVPAWHGLGTVIDRAATAEDAMRLAGLAGWDLQKLQTYVDFRDQRLLANAWAIIRGDTGDLLGTVGSRYKIITNEQVFSLMDDIVGDGGAHYETAGAIGKGEMAWMLAQMPDHFEPVAGDEMVPYLLATTKHDGTGAGYIFPTVVRVECANTLSRAVRGRRNGFSLRHVGDVTKKCEEAQRILGLARKRIGRFQEQCEVLTRAKLEPEEYFDVVLDDVLAVTIAERDVTIASISNGSVLQAIADMQDTESKLTECSRFQRVIERRKELLSDLVERYESERNGGKPGLRGTAYAAFNTVTEQVDHSPLWRANANSERRFVSNVMGPGDEIKAVAFERAIAAAV